jgi:two-component system sensor histidine kinase BaeS
VVLDVDAVRIREVLTNVVANALQHNPGGGAVTVAVDATSDGAVVSVSDTGPGLPPSDVARMFDRFSKGAASRGSGLGLAIAKGIVKAHGGEIAALSQPGLGTTVTVTLPAKSPM